MTKTRTRLAAAIKAHEDALAQVKRASDMLEGARNQRTCIEVKLSQYADLDSEMAMARATNVVRVLEGEDIALDEPIAGFASQLVARDKARSELASLDEALPVLEENVQDAMRYATDTEHEIELACEAVFCAEAETLAADFMEKLSELRETLYVLRHFGIRQVKRHPNEWKNSSTPYAGSGAYRKIGVSDKVLLAAQENIIGDSEYKGGIATRERVAAETAAYWIRLHHDPKATLKEK